MRREWRSLAALSAVIGNVNLATFAQDFTILDAEKRHPRA